MWEYRGAASWARALIDFLSQTAKCCMQDWVPRETMYNIGFDIPVRDRQNQGALGKGKVFAPPPLPHMCPCSPLSCSLWQWKEKHRKNLQMGLCFSKWCLLREKNVFKFDCQVLKWGRWWEGWGGVLEQQGPCLPSVLPSPPTPSGSGTAPRASLHCLGGEVFGWVDFPLAEGLAPVGVYSHQPKGEGGKANLLNSFVGSPSLRGLGGKAAWWLSGFKRGDLCLGGVWGSHCVPHTSTEQRCNGWGSARLVSAHPCVGQDTSPLECQAG